MSTIKRHLDDQDMSIWIDLINKFNIQVVEQDCLITKSLFDDRVFNSVLTNKLLAQLLSNTELNCWTKPIKIVRISATLQLSVQ